MADQLAEYAARQILAETDLVGAGEHHFAATRRDGGWSFAWRRDRGQPPVGSPRWVVADNGVARRIAIGERASEAIQAILERS